MRISLYPLCLALTILNALVLCVTSAMSEIVCKKSDRKFSPHVPEAGAEVIKGYDCGSVRVEFVRLNKSAFALLEKKKSRRIEDAIGTTSLVETTIVKAYKKLGASSARSIQDVRSQRNCLIRTPARRGITKASPPYLIQSTVPILKSNTSPPWLKCKSSSNGDWPEGLMLFASELQGVPEEEKGYLKTTLWRSVTTDDIKNLEENSRQFNSTISEPTLLARLSGIAHSISYFRYGGDLPKELIRLQGWQSEWAADCALASSPIPLSSEKPQTVPI